MITHALARDIEALAKKYPNRESALVPALDLVLDSNRSVLTPADARAIAEMFRISYSRVWGIAKHHEMIGRRPVGQYHLRVDGNVPSMLFGADAILQHLEHLLGIKVGGTTADGLFTLSNAGELGSIGNGPLIQVNDVFFESMTVEAAGTLVKFLQGGVMPMPEKVRLAGGEVLGTRTLHSALERDAYKALHKALAMTPGAVMEEIGVHISRGSGETGFSAGLPFGFIPRGGSRPVYLICNADEGEPGTFNNRQIMEFEPHLLLEGMAIAAHAVGSRKAFIYLRRAFRWISKILEEAVNEASRAGLLGKLEIVVHRGGGPWVCGQQTSLIDSIEGRLGNPRLRLLPPVRRGLYNCPTLVNSVETFACLPEIIDRGAEAFRSTGHAAGDVPKIFSVGGHVHRPEVYPFTPGNSLNMILAAAGGRSRKTEGRTCRRSPSHDPASGGD